MQRLLLFLCLCLSVSDLYGQRKGTLMQRKETFIDIREQLGLYAAIVKKNTRPAPAFWQKVVESRECDEMLLLPDGDILLGTVDLRSKAKGLVGGALTGHGVYALFPNYSTLYKVDARTGEILWKYERTGEMGTAVYGLVDVSDTAIVMLQGDGQKDHLLQLDLASGKESWRNQIGHGSQCLKVGNNILVFSLSDKGELGYTGYSLSNGTQLYAAPAGKASADYRPTAFGAGKIAVTDGAACWLIDAASGEKVERPLAAADYTNIYASSTCILLVSANGDCAMLDGEGRELWNIRAGSAPRLCEECDGSFYWVAQEGGTFSLSAVDSRNGEQRWNCPLDGPVMSSGFTVQGSTLALTTVSSLWFIDIGTGEPVRRIAVPVGRGRIPDLIQRRNDNWIVTYETAIECYDDAFEKQWDYSIGPFVRTVEEPEMSDGKYAVSNPMQAMAGFHTSMFSLQHSINNDYATFVKYGKFNPSSTDSPVSAASIRQSARMEKQNAAFALAGTAATIGASIYFEIMAQKMRAEYAKADNLRAIYAYRLSHRETEATNQLDYYIRRFETDRSRNLLVVDLNDGSWAEIVLGPRETAAIEQNALLNTCLYVYHPDEDMIMVNGIGLEPSKWETTDINKTTTVKSSLLSFRMSDMNFRLHDEYAANTIAK